MAGVTADQDLVNQIKYIVWHSSCTYMIASSPGS